MICRPTSSTASSRRPDAEPVIEFLHRETVKVLSMPDTREKLATMGFDPVASTPEEFAQWIRTEIVRWGKVIRDANIALQ